MTEQYSHYEAYFGLEQQAREAALREFFSGGHYVGSSQETTKTGRTLHKVWGNFDSQIAMATWIEGDAEPKFYFDGEEFMP